MDFSIILPALNEAENLPSVLRDLRNELGAINIKYEIIVVVDSKSTDSTCEVLDFLKKEIPELRYIKPELSSGFGDMIISGLSRARGEVLGFMDADGQIKAKDLVSAYRKLKEDKIDLCRGVRSIRHDSFTRKLFSKIFHFAFKMMIGSKFDDINGKPKVFLRSAYKDISPVSKDWFLDAEIILKAENKKFKIGEIPVTYFPRTKGYSKVRLITVFEFIKNMIRYRFFNKF